MTGTWAPVSSTYFNQNYTEPLVFSFKIRASQYGRDFSQQLKRMISQSSLTDNNMECQQAICSNLRVKKLTAILDFHKGSQLKLLMFGPPPPFGQSKHPLFLLNATETTVTRDPLKRGRKQKVRDTSSTALCSDTIQSLLFRHTSQSRPFPFCQNLPHGQGRHHHEHRQWLTADWGHTEPSNTASTPQAHLGLWDILEMKYQLAFLWSGLILGMDIIIFKTSV